MPLTEYKFMQSEIQDLGFIVDNKGIQLDSEKIKVMRAMLPPKYVREV